MRRPGPSSPRPKSAWASAWDRAPNPGSRASGSRCWTREILPFNWDSCTSWSSTRGSSCIPSGWLKIRAAALPRRRERRWRPKQRRRFTLGRRRTYSSTLISRMIRYLLAWRLMSIEERRWGCRLVISKVSRKHNTHLSKTSESLLPQALLKLRVWLKTLKWQRGSRKWN